MANTYISFDGGLKLETPPIEAPPGSCLEALNFYESVKGGYTTMLGYERYDGLPKPSEASYYHILIEDFDLALGAVNTTVGQTIVIDTLTFDVAFREENPGGTELILIGVESTGSAPADGAYPIAFDTNASCTAITALGDATQAWETNSQNYYLGVAQSVRRALISPLPGTGSVRGVGQINDLVIGWRDDGAELKAYKDSAASWVEIPLAAVYEVDVTAATVATVGDVCNGGQDKIVDVQEYLAAGAPDTNKRVYIVKRISGAVPTGFINDVGAVNHGSVLGTVAWTPTSGGSVRTYNHNFYAGLDTYNMYFADGVNVAMWYSTADDVICPISTDYRVLDDVVSYVIAFNASLFLATNGGTYLTSVAGEPTTLSALYGAQEIGVGDDITGFAQTASDKLAIFTRNQTYALSGTDSSTWEQRVASKNSGARDGCIAQTDDVFSSDDRGITKLSRTETLGGFQASTITDDVQSLFNVVHGNATCATTIRSLNQMRFFYGTRGIIASRVPYNANGNEGIRYGITESLYSTSVLCVNTEEDSSGDEKTYFGSTDGYVYQMDAGTNADGADMEFICTLHYNHMGSPLVRKRFRGADFEATVTAPTTMQIYYYMNDGKKSFDPRTLAFVGGESNWDEGLFDSAVFDAVPLTRPRMTLRGTGYNVQFSFYRQSSQEPQATLTGYALRYKERGLVAI